MQKKKLYLNNNLQVLDKYWTNRTKEMRDFVNSITFTIFYLTFVQK